MKIVERKDFYIPSTQRSWRGVYWFHLVRLSVDRIMSALYLLQYLLEPLHFYTSYQAISEDVSHIFLIQHWKVWSLANSLYSNRRQTITWTNDDSVHWCKYAALEGDELTEHVNVKHGHAWSTSIKQLNWYLHFMFKNNIFILLIRIK